MTFIDFIILGTLYILFTIIIYLIVNTINKHSIKKNNKIIEHIENINKNYKSLFYFLDTNYTFEFECNSLQKYKNNNNDNSIFNYLCNIVNENPNQWQNLITIINQNKNIYQKYMTNISTIQKQYSGLGYQKNKYIFLSKKKYLKIEDSLCQKVILKPPITIKITITIFYISPAGRNRYFTDYICNEKIVIEALKKLEEKKKYEQTKEYQRLILTPKKRYEILKRDNFKCQICGRTQADGVKLEVDHIIPISKGGKTVDENLRTLCHDCNIGKSDKLE